MVSSKLANHFPLSAIVGALLAGNFGVVAGSCVGPRVGEKVTGVRVVGPVLGLKGTGATLIEEASGLELGIKLDFGVGYTLGQAVGLIVETRAGECDGLVVGEEAVGEEVRALVGLVVSMLLVVGPAGELEVISILRTCFLMLTL
jgi:hypothetical protein